MNAAEAASSPPLDAQSTSNAPPPPPPSSSSSSAWPSRHSSSSSSLSRRGRRSAGPSNLSGPVTLYQHPFYKSGGPRQGCGATSASPPLRISTRRLQVFSYVLAELSSAATLLPDYTRAILNLSRRLIGAWQAVTAAAIARTRYEHALIWAAYRHRQHQRQRHATPTAATHEQQLSAAQHGRRRGTKRRGSLPAQSDPTTTKATSAAVSLFNAAAGAATASPHKRRRLGGEEGGGASSCVRHARPSSALKIKRALHGGKREEQQQQQQLECEGLTRTPPLLPPRVSARSTGRTRKAVREKGPRARHGRTSPLLLPLPGTGERRSRQLALRHREQLFLMTLQQLWIDAQEKEDKAGQHVEYLRGLIVGVLFQQYLGVLVEQSYHDLVLYRWLAPVLVSVRDGVPPPTSECGGGKRGQGYTNEEEDVNADTMRTMEKGKGEWKDELRSRGFHCQEDQDWPAPLAGELEHGGGGNARRARRRQAAAQVSQDVRLLRQMLRCAQITLGPSTDRDTATAFTADSTNNSNNHPPQQHATMGNAASQLASSSSSSASSLALSKKRRRSRSTSPSTPAGHSQRDISSSEAETEKPSAAAPPSPLPHATAATAAAAAQVDDDESSFYSTLRSNDQAPVRSPLLPESVIAVPLPLQLFLQACTSFDPTHCAFSLMSRCVVLAQHVRSEDEEQAKPANSTASPPHSNVHRGESNPRNATISAAVRPSSYDETKNSDRNDDNEELEEQKEEYAGLFYVVIARRAVGACGHTALCFGNHKFIFVRCRNTEALIREVMLSEEEEEDGEERESDDKKEELYGHLGRNDDEHAVDEAKGAEVHTHHLHTPSCSASQGKGVAAHTNAQQSTVRTAETSPAVDSPFPPPPPPFQSPVRRSHIGITALTEQDARRLQCNAGADGIALRAPSVEEDQQATHHSPPNNNIPSLCPASSHLPAPAAITTTTTAMTPSTAEAVHDANSTPAHVAPVLGPLLSSAASTNSTASSNASSPSAAAAAARRWGRHMRQAAWAGPCASPPPFVSADVTDLQVNPGFTEGAAALLPTPPARTLRTHTLPPSASQEALLLPPSSSSSATAATTNNITAEGTTNVENATPATRDSALTQGSPLPPTEPFFPNADLADVSPGASVHSPLHLTPLAFHTRLRPGSSERSRAPLAPPSLDLNSQRTTAPRKPGEPNAGLRVDSSDNARLNTGLPPLPKSPDATTELFPEHRSTSPDSPRLTEGTNEHRSYSGSEYDERGEGAQNSRTSSLHDSYNDINRFALDEDEDDDDMQPPYVIMHSVLCSCVRGTSDTPAANSSDHSNNNNSSSGGATHLRNDAGRNSGRRSADAWRQVGDRHPPSIPSVVPRESAFPSSLRAAEALGGLHSDNLHTDSKYGNAVIDDFPLSYFEQQVLLPPGGGQDRRLSSASASQRQFATALSAMRSSSAHRAAAASHLFHMADPSHAAATAGRGNIATAVIEGEEEAEAEAEAEEEAEEEERIAAKAAAAAQNEEKGQKGKEKEEEEEEKAMRRRRENLSSSSSLATDTELDNKAAAAAGWAREDKQRHNDQGAQTTSKPPSSRKASSMSPTSPLSSPVEPTEGDMAFAAELYARLEFWCLRGQDRSAYIDPSWLRKDAAAKDSDGDDASNREGSKAEGEAKSVQPTTLTAVRHDDDASTTVLPALQHQAKKQAKADSGRDARPPSRLSSSSASSFHNSVTTSNISSTTPSSTTDPDDSDGAARAPTGMVRLPLKLLDYTAGSIELADEAFLTKQQRKRHAAKAAAWRSSRMEKKRARQHLHDEEEEEVGREEETGKDAHEGFVAESADTSSTDLDEREDDEDDDEDDSGSFPLLTPLMTVNAKGKELLFEALHEATEVVVCAVRESRAHVGYHDLLHQRCPPPSTPFITPTTHPPSSFSAPSHHHVNAGNGGGSSALQGASPTLAAGGALTTVNRSWAVTAAVAAAQGCTFPVATGTLSRDERCPFTFDRHQHLGTYGTVRWSQGNAAVAERREEGGDGSGGGSASTVTAADVSESSISLLPPPSTLSASATPSSSAETGREKTGATDTGNTEGKHTHMSSIHRTPPKHDTTHKSSSGGGGAAGVSPSRAWHWPALPANDEKQWRCELLKSEFRLARSRCLDALLVDRVHGRPVAAITLEPRTWTQVRDAPSSPLFSTRGHATATHNTSNGNDNNGEKSSPSEGKDLPSSQAESPLSFAYLPASTQEVVERTVYVVTSFTHYVAPLWRHLQEEKAVLVDMDRTLVDNAITVRSLAERQRHLLHLNRAVAAMEGRPGADNPCLLWRSSVLRRDRPSSARFSALPFRLSRNDAAPLSLEELLWSEESVAGQAASGGRTVSGRPASASNRRSSSQPSLLSFTRQDAHRAKGVGDGTGEKQERRGWMGESLLHAFLNRTVAQREALATLHYEECGAVTYAAGALYSTTTGMKVSDNSSNNGGGGGEDSSPQQGKAAPSAVHPAPSLTAAASDAIRAGTTKNNGGSGGRRGSSWAAGLGVPPRATATDCGGVYSDFVYVRPGVRQFLYRTAVQWNIPVVLVTKSTRSRTEAIVHNVLDPHRILFSNRQSCMVTADEMLSSLSSLEHCEHATAAAPHRHPENNAHHNSSGRLSSTGLTAAEAERGREDAGEEEEEVNAGEQRQHLSQDDQGPASGPTSSSSTAIAERIAHCRKSTIRVLQSVLDAAALEAARRAWRAPAWCDLSLRLPKPRSIAVLDDAPQVWEERDWPCTVNIAPYTLARVDPFSYFSPHGFMSALVLSCLFGSKCLVCSSGELRVGAGAGAAATPSSHSSRQASPSRGEGSIRSPLSDAARRGPERWPHCVCVCPPDHQDEIAQAEGIPEDQFTSYANDAAASVKAMIAELVWRASPSHSVALRRLQPLLLPTVKVDAPVVVEEGPSPRSGKSTTASRRLAGAADDNKDNSSDGANKPTASPYTQFHNPRQQQQQQRGHGGCASPSLHSHTSPLIEDVQPLPVPLPEAFLGSSASSVKGIERLDQTSRPAEEKRVERVSSSESNGQASHLPLIAQPQVSGRGGARGVGAERSTRRLAPLATDVSSGTNDTISSSSSSTSSSLSNASVSGDGSPDASDSSYSFPGAGAAATMGGPAGLAMGASMPATPTSFHALPGRWSHGEPSADNHSTGSISTTPNAITRGVADVAVNASLAEETESGLGMGGLGDNHNGDGGGLLDAPCWRSGESSDAALADAHSKTYEDVEPSQLAETLRGSGAAHVQDVTVEDVLPTYAPARSRSDSTDVEDVVPLEVQPIASPVNKGGKTAVCPRHLSAVENKGKEGEVEEQWRQDRNAGPAVRNLTHGGSASPAAPAPAVTVRNEANRTTTATAPRVSTGSAAEQDENVTPPQVCVGELRRPERRRLDDPRDDVEDVVPL